MDLPAVLTPAEEGGYVALNPETGTTTRARQSKRPSPNCERVPLSISRSSPRGPRPSGRDHLLSVGACLDCLVSPAPKR